MLLGFASIIIFPWLYFELYCKQMVSMPIPTNSCVLGSSAWFCVPHIRAEPLFSNWAARIGVYDPFNLRYWLLWVIIRFSIVLFLAGTDEAAITEVLAHRTVTQRQRIKEAYKQAVGKVSVFDRAVLEGSKQKRTCEWNSVFRQKSTRTTQRNEHKKNLKSSLDGDYWQQQWMCHLLASYSIVYSLILLSH